MRMRMPRTSADQLDAYLARAGAGASTDVMGSVMKGLGGMFGGGK